jgi:hypothetical protein
MTLDRDPDPDRHRSHAANSTDSEDAGPEAGRSGIRVTGHGVITAAYTQVTLFARKAPVRRQPISNL